MLNYAIKSISQDIIPELTKKIDTKTKPLGALGKLEKLALKVGNIQNTLSPELKQPTIVVFAGDHGIADEGVSLFPQEVTCQMVLNFLNGGAGINVFCRQNNIDIKVVDAGVINDFESHPLLIDGKINKGTKNFLREPAMTEEECIKAIEKGSEIVKNLHNNGCNIIGFGEMGIANTSSAAIILSLLGKIPVEKCAGRGTGLCDDALNKKIKILQESIKNHKIDNSPLAVLKTFGGFEIAMMTGAMLQAAELGMILLIDGFIVSSALVVASEMYPSVLDYCIFAHKSNEQGHKLMLEHLKADALLDLGFRLGEGTGVAVAYPIVESAVAFLNEMASFESANVSESVK